MDVRELRIGNYIMGNSKVYAIRADENLAYVTVPEGHGCVSLDHAHPIPLTPEILEKAGFEYFDGYYGNTLCSVFAMNMTEWGIVYDGVKIYVGFEYLHQLQNLYFALTGEELNIELWAM
jgi:hypothetical protein